MSTTGNPIDTTGFDSTVGDLSTSASPIGAVVPVNPSDSDAAAALNCGMITVNANSNSNQLLVVVSVIQSTKQVVAGLKFHFLVEAGISSCANVAGSTTYANKQCPIVGYTSYFAVDVVVQPWISSSCGTVSVNGQPVVSATTTSTVASTTGVPASTTAVPLTYLTSSITFVGGSVSGFDSTAFVVMLGQYLGVDTSAISVLSSTDISAPQAALLVVVLIKVPSSQSADVLATLDQLYQDTAFLDMFLASQPLIGTVTSSNASTSSTSGTGSSSSSSSTGLIVGVAIGCTAFVVLVVLAVASFRSRGRLAPAPAVAPMESVSFVNPAFAAAAEPTLLVNPIYQETPQPEPAYSDVQLHIKENNYVDLVI